MENEEDLVCRNATLVALNKIQEKCKGKSPKMVELGEGIMVWVPSNPAPGDQEGLTCDERVLSVGQSDWAKGVARGLATKLFGLKPGEPGYEEAMKRAALKVAAGAVSGCEGVDIDKLVKRWI